MSLKTEKQIISNRTVYDVKSISLGQYHASLVANDTETSSEFNPLHYARAILEELRLYLDNDYQKRVLNKEA